MESLNQIKKLERKLKRFQRIIEKETGVICVSTPTKILVICNVGLVNGLTEDVVIDKFKPFGTLENVILLPGKSCSFVRFREETSAKAAYDEYNGKLNIAQDGKPIYLNFVNNLPQYEEDKSWTKLPDGLIILPNFIDLNEEKSLLELVKFEDVQCGSMKNRQVKHFGYEFRYDINNVDKDKPLEESILKECNFLWDKLRIAQPKFYNFMPDQLTINHYTPGQGIPHHVDTHSAFEDPILSLSLGSSVLMDFKNGNKHYCVLLPRRSLLIMSGESRYDWTHGITPRKYDVVKSTEGFTTLERNVRISYTFRKVLIGECVCNYQDKCDSYERLHSSKKIEESVASKLEQTHVHDVYENIANHFSDTRHKPWPNVLDFVQSFALGSVLVDIGCGNGKYLGHNKNIFELGCDRSFGLIDVCQKRQFNVFNANCLNVPLKDNTADAAISIAVIHHLANEERRLTAIQEMVRILKLNGQALIYVWAKDQHKDKQKSSYIKQDRKNRKSDDLRLENSKEEVVSISEDLTLPLHTNRTQFKHKDLLVPWKLKDGRQTDQNTFLRFYHVFEEGELEKLCLRIENIEIIKSYYDQGNWCVIFKKIK